MIPEDCDYLVVGTGSIASRHITNLKKLFPECVVGNVSSSGKKSFSSKAEVCYKTIDESVRHTRGFAIIASPAKFHLEQSCEFLKENIPVFIEKPLSMSSDIDNSLLEILFENEDIIDIGYNLRFLPVLNKFKKILTEEIVGNIYSVSARVGQYLPTWRPNTDYKDGVSGSKELGGGVLLELSHELDYLLWLFEDFEKVFCIKKNSGLLQINVEDNIDALLTTKTGYTVNLHMNFLDLHHNRSCRVAGSKGILTLDFLKNRITFDSSEDENVVIYEDKSYDRNSMYLDEISHFQKVSVGEEKPAIGLSQGIKILQLIDSMKISCESSKIVNFS